MEAEGTLKNEQHAQKKVRRLGAEGERTGRFGSRKQKAVPRRESRVTGRLQGRKEAEKLSEEERAGSGAKASAGAGKHRVSMGALKDEPIGGAIER